VSQLLAMLLLAIVTLSWFGVALLPALIELRRRTDVAPLQLRRGSGDVRHFALSFQKFVDAELAALGDAVKPVPGGTAVSLRDGQPAWVIAAVFGPTTLPVDWMPKGALATHVILSESDLMVPNGCALLKELYLSRSLRGGVDASYRAVLALGDVSLGARSEVLRWIDAGGRLEVGESSVLHGRASAGSEMRLLDGVRFQRVAAPTMHFGSPVVDEVVAATRHPALETPALGMAAIPRARPSVVMGTRAPLEPPPGVTESWGRWLIEGDFSVPDGEYVVMDLVVTGVLTLGAGARVLGAVKAAVLLGGAGAIYNGAIVATSRLDLAAGSVVAGPVVVEGEANIGDGTRIGSPEDPTTISAVSVRMGRRSTVHGEIWARAWGITDKG
jgi:hypothetical protein